MMSGMLRAWCRHFGRLLAGLGLVLPLALPEDTFVWRIVRPTDEGAPQPAPVSNEAPQQTSEESGASAPAAQFVRGFVPDGFVPRRTATATATEWQLVGRRDVGASYDRVGADHADAVLPSLTPPWRLPAADDTLVIGLVGAQTAARPPDPAIGHAILPHGPPLL